MRRIGPAVVVLGLLISGTAAADEPDETTYVLDHEPPSVVDLGDEVTEVLTATDEGGNAEAADTALVAGTRVERG